MENNDMQHNHTHGDGSNCNNCCGWGGRHGGGHWRYIIVKILVALFIFWCGVQFGELKAMLHAQLGGYGNYGGGMMGQYYQ